jgi:hypothetical protein
MINPPENTFRITCKFNKSVFEYLHEVQADCTSFSTSCISRDPPISVPVQNTAVTGRGENRIGPSELLSTSTDAQKILAGKYFGFSL